MVMTTDNVVHLATGAAIVASAAVAHFRPAFNKKAWIVAAALGATLMQSAFTGTCPLTYVLTRAGVPTECPKKACA